MRSRNLLLALATWLLPASAFATDVAYGADSLPYLDDRANAVVRVDAAEREPSPAEGIARYRARVTESIKGSLAAGASIAVLTPAGFDVRDAKELNQRILFLRGPLSAEELKQAGASSESNAFWLVSGRFGALGEAAPAPNESQVRDYLALDKTEQRVEWAQKQLAGKDSYLQRSALFELARPENAADPRAVESLGTSLTSDAVTPANKEAAVGLLARTDSPVALTALTEAATAVDTSESLRRTVVETLPALPNGENALREMAKSGSLQVKSLAREVLQQLPDKAPAPDASIQEFRDLLNSPQSFERQRALDQLGTLKASPAVIAALHEAVQTKTPGGIADRLAIVERVGRYQTPDAAKLLESVALDGTQPETVRSAAVLQIANLPSGLALPILQDIAQKVKPGSIHDLAVGLGAP